MPHFQARMTAKKISIRNYNFDLGLKQPLVPGGNLRTCTTNNSMKEQLNLIDFPCYCLMHMKGVLKGSKSDPIIKI